MLIVNGDYEVEKHPFQFFKEQFIGWMFVIVVEEGLSLAIMEGIGKLVDDRCAESQKTSILEKI